MKRIAVLMTCYNRVQTTLSCLESLFACSVPDGIGLDVWLVDDASPDETGKKVKAIYPDVHILKSEGDLYWCRGMRYAWEQASSYSDYDYYLWLNDDVKLVHDAIFRIIRNSLIQADASIVYGSTTEDGTPETPKTYGMRRYGEMNGNFVLVQKKVFQKVGYIYGGFHHAYGDHDYAWQAIKRGISLVECDKIIGRCLREPVRYSHMDGRSLIGRLKLLVDVKGYNLHDAVIYKYRKSGIIGAILSCGHIVWLVLRGIPASDRN